MSSSPTLTITLGLLLVILVSIPVISLNLKSVREPTGQAAANTLIVGSGGYSTIQAAVNAAADGDIIQVRAGTYNEQVKVTKPLTLQGDTGAIIDGQCSRENGIEIVQERDLEIGGPLYADVSNITVSGFEIRNTRRSGVHIGNSDDLPMSVAPHDTTIRNNYIHDFNCDGGGDHDEAGVASYFGGARTTIMNNTIRFRHNLSDTADGQRSISDGIFFFSRNINPSGGGHIITGNLVVGGWDGIGGWGEDQKDGVFDQDTLVENNTIRTCSDDGISAEGGGQNNRLRGNNIAGCLAGIAIASPISGPTYVENNTIDSTGGQYCFKVGNPSTATAHIIGNRCTGFKGIQQTDPQHANLVVRSNCFNVQRYVFEFPYGPSSGLDFDGDTMFSGGTPFKWDNVLYSTLSAFQSASGQERTGQATSSCPLSGGTTPPPPPPPSSKVGDINGDGSVNILDLSVLLTKWGTTDAAADLSKNGKVDIIDLSILLSKWGS